VGEAERRDDLGGVHRVARRGAAGSPAGSAAALAKEPRVRDVSARDGVAPLLEREQPRALEDVAQVLEGEGCARVEGGRGHAQ
jgi:hypothetical protein